MKSILDENVLACEMGGRRSDKSRHFLHQLSKAKGGQQPPLLQQRVRHAWFFRWGSMLLGAGLVVVGREGWPKGGWTPWGDDVVWEVMPAFCQTEFGQN